MCLAIPAKITRLDESGTGIVSHLGNEVRTNFALLPEAPQSEIGSSSTPVSPFPGSRPKKPGKR